MSEKVRVLGRSGSQSFIRNLDNDNRQRNYNQCDASVKDIRFHRRLSTLLSMAALTAIAIGSCVAQEAHRLDLQPEDAYKVFSGWHQSQRSLSDARAAMEDLHHLNTADNEIGSIDPMKSMSLPGFIHSSVIAAGQLGITYMLFSSPLVGDTFTLGGAGNTWEHYVRMRSIVVRHTAIASKRFPRETQLDAKFKNPLGEALRSLCAAFVKTRRIQSTIAAQWVEVPIMNLAEPSADVMFWSGKISGVHLGAAKIEIWISSTEPQRIMNVAPDSSGRFSESIKVDTDRIFAMKVIALDDKLRPLASTPLRYFVNLPQKIPANFDPIANSGWSVVKLDAQPYWMPKMIRHRETRIELVLIPQDGFSCSAPVVDRLASPGDLLWQQVEVPEPYYIGRYEVTNEQYRRFRPDHDSGNYYTDNGIFSLNNPDQPAADITWIDANLYANAFGFELPTEVEWEYAARAGAPASLPWGDIEHVGIVHANMREGSLHLVSEFTPNPISGINDGIAPSSPVGSFRANGFGVYDMVGNVWEWCADEHIDPDSCYGFPAELGVPRVLKGGCFMSVPKVCRISSRTGAPSADRWQGYGFRVVKRIKR